MSKLTNDTFRDLPRPTGPGAHPYYDYQPVEATTKRARMVPDKVHTPWSITENPHEKLTPGVVYNVVKFEERSWHTRVYLDGVDGCFNSLDLEADKDES